MTHSIELIGIIVQLVCIRVQLICTTMLLGCILLLLIGPFVLYCGNLVLLIRQTLLAFSEVKAFLCLVQKSVGRFFKNYFFNPHFDPRNYSSLGETVT